jgi:SPP1 gp7 family putative phage head morphogenesis protein
MNINTQNKISLSKYDPTHTTALRNAFVRDMKRRFTELKRVVYEALVKKDCLGLKKGSFDIHQVSPPGDRAYAFLRDPAKVEAFMRWLERQVQNGILTVGEFIQVGAAIENAWTNMYVSDSYKRGILRAKYEMQKAGITLPITGEMEGVEMSMLNPFHMDRVGLLYTRVFSDLKGITMEMDTIISRILSQSMIDGDGPVLIARKLIAAIDGTGANTLGITDRLGRFIPAQRRAMILARTETIRAFHLATIQEYRNWGIEGVFVMAEWMTAGDDRVCEDCAGREGQIYTLDEIEPLIPFHPQCRCIALPYLKN